MSIIIFLIFGFIVGLVARALTPGRDAMGVVGTTALGVAGSLLGYLLGRAVGLYHQGERATGAGFIVSTLGAILLLAIANLVRKRRTTQHPV
jgi:uncharacterized membrane protein YeaQ/YmgE (transglycosylase-associated protein family)